MKLRGAFLMALFALATWLPARTAGAIPMIRGLGGAADFGEQNLPANDDGSTDIIDIRGAFPRGIRFFGTTFTSLWLNNNGNVTFRSALYTYTPTRFPVTDQPMIAPYWGDVDTRGGGYPGINGVFWDITPGRFVATWWNVGYYGRHNDRLNSFQLVLLDRTDRAPGDFDVEFRYERCEWTTGDASGGSGGFGGTPAQAGFDAGDRRNYYVLPGSFTMEVLNLCRTSNVGAPGLWRFQIRNGEFAECGNGRLEPGEECDDGNLRNGDGCSDACRFERDDRPDVIDVTDVQWPDIVVDGRPDNGPDIIGPDMGVDVPVADGADIVGSDGADVPSPQDAPEACTGWRCGRENRLYGGAGPPGACVCSAPGLGATRSRRLGWAASSIGALLAGAVVWRRRGRRRPG